jgi:hypothetical protein
MLGSGTGLDRVTAVVDEVLEKLREHYERHQEEYAEAYQLYRKAALEDVQDRAVQLDQSHEIPIGVDAPDLRFDLSPPDDHRLEYERAIGMLELHKRAEDKCAAIGLGDGDHKPATIKITPELYAAYMQDQWEWKAAFYHKNLSYHSVRGRIR